MNSKIPTILVLLWTLTLTGLSAQSLQARLVRDGFVNPVEIAQAGGEVLYIVEKAGLVKALPLNGDGPVRTVLDLRARVRSSGFEQGLLGLAFHPEFPDSNYLYVNYTRQDGNTRVSRLTAAVSPELSVDISTERILLEQPQPFENHNAGDLAFGPDGMLYITMGDGGSGGDPEEAGQDRLTWLGKLLRIDVDRGDPYAIPEDNPFAQTDFTLDEIWALGLRNPWRISFDRATGDLWIGDVGQGEWEEINRQPADSPGGENYGWDCYEGNQVFETGDCPAMSELTFPVHVYDHGGGNCSVTGGFVYRGTAIPERIGQYFFADWCSGKVWALKETFSGGWVREEVLDLEGNITTFGEDAGGELYFATGQGSIYRIESAVTNLATEPLQLTDLYISPNPAKEQAWLSFKAPEAGRYRFNLLNMQGQVLQSWEDNVNGAYRQSLYLEKLPAGVYSLQIQLEGASVSRLLSKQ